MESFFIHCYTYILLPIEKSTQYRCDYATYVVKHTNLYLTKNMKVKVKNSGYVKKYNQMWILFT